MAFLKLTSSSMSSFFLAIFLISTLIALLRPCPTMLPGDQLPPEIANKLSVEPDAIAAASTDFGRLTKASPAAVFHPASVADVATLVRSSYESFRPFTIAARGHGHSIRGQALAPDGVVVEMRSLTTGIRVSECGQYVDAGGERLWIDVLHETLKHGLAPRSWTDYLYLTVGGTLSNAGVSGQAFRHGPQISNVFELDVVTGKGELVTCSEEINSDLFFAVLGGLGQFGIITRARIALEMAPERVRWVRLIYTHFVTFTRDQEWLISSKGMKNKGFDYVEGSLLMNQGLISGWRSSFFSGRDLERLGELVAKNEPIYCLEAAMYYNYATVSSVDQDLNYLLDELNFSQGFAFVNDVSYLHFLDRVHEGELKLRAKGLWDVPHPWLNIFVPKTRIQDINVGVFRGILNNNISFGPILIYPTNRSKWNEKMSVMIPDEEIFYSIGVLVSGMHDLDRLEQQNMEILSFCDREGIKYKHYLPHYRNQADWIKHFGHKWVQFVEMKKKYDPRTILAPGQGIFTSSLVDHQQESGDAVGQL